MTFRLLRIWVSCLEKKKKLHENSPSLSQMSGCWNMSLHTCWEEDQELIRINYGSFSSWKLITLQDSVITVASLLTLQLGHRHAKISSCQWRRSWEILSIDLSPQMVLACHDHHCKWEDHMKQSKVLFSLIDDCNLQQIVRPPEEHHLYTNAR